MQKEKIKFIGLDVGGTKILVEGFDLTFKKIASQTVPTDTRSAAALRDQLFSLIDGFFHKKIRGIGIAFPGIVDRETGTLVHAPHLPTPQNWAIKAGLKQRYKAPVHVEHDVNAFLLAQMTQPRLQKFKNVLAVMPGTGLGGAIVINGQLYTGARGFAGEFGHMIMAQNEALKTLEQRVAGSSFGAIAKACGAGKFRQPSDLLKAPARTLKKLKNTLAENLGAGLSNLNLIFNPEAVVLGGSIYRFFLKDQKTALKKIIASHSLDKNAPLLIDDNPRLSVAFGAVLAFRK